MCLITFCRLLFSGSILALDLIEDFLDMISQAINKDNDELTKSVSLRSSQYDSSLLCCKELCPLIIREDNS